MSRRAPAIPVPRVDRSCYFVNVGEFGPHRRSWDDMARYGFVSAGGKAWYANCLKCLKVGHEVFSYIKHFGYVGHGVVETPRMPVREFEVPDGLLLDQELIEPEIGADRNDLDKCEYVVGVKWLTVLRPNQAKTFKGIEAHSRVICKIRSVETQQFLRREFEPVDTSEYRECPGRC